MQLLVNSRLTCLILRAGKVLSFDILGGEMYICKIKLKPTTLFSEFDVTCRHLTINLFIKLNEQDQKMKNIRSHYCKHNTSMNIRLLKQFNAAFFHTQFRSTKLVSHIFYSMYINLTMSMSVLHLIVFSIFSG